MGVMRRKGFKNLVFLLFFSIFSNYFHNFAWADVHFWPYFTHWNVPIRIWCKSCEPFLFFLHLVRFFVFPQILFFEQSNYKLCFLPNKEIHKPERKFPINIILPKPQQYLSLLKRFRYVTWWCHIPHRRWGLKLFQFSTISNYAISFLRIFELHLKFWR